MSFHILNIISWLEKHQLPCLFKQLTHIDCPGCGMQRSLLLLLNGEVLSSFKMYPALVPIMLLFGFLVLHLIFKIRNGTIILKYSYIFCAGIIMLSYIYKLIITKTQLFT
jgi:Protein of unknown function (DUF2752)